MIPEFRKSSKEELVPGLMVYITTCMTYAYILNANQSGNYTCVWINNFGDARRETIEMHQLGLIDYNINTSSIQNGDYVRFIGDLKGRLLKIYGSSQNGNFFCRWINDNKETVEESFHPKVLIPVK